MGYSYMGVLVSLDDVIALYNSHNDTIFTQMQSPICTYPRYLMELKEDTTSDKLSALDEILRGGDCQSYEPHIYAYAVEAYCFEFGESIVEMDTRDLWRAIDFMEVVDVHDELLLDVVDVKWPLPIPDTGNYPLVGWARTEQCALRRDELWIIENKLPEPTTREERLGLEFIKDTRSMYAQAVEKKSDLIIFNH